MNIQQKKSNPNWGNLWVEEEKTSFSSNFNHSFNYINAMKICLEDQLDKRLEKAGWISALRLFEDFS